MNIKRNPEFETLEFGPRSMVMSKWEVFKLRAGCLLTTLAILGATYWLYSVIIDRAYAPTVGVDANEIILTTPAEQCRVELGALPQMCFETNEENKWEYEKSRVQTNFELPEVK